MNQATILIVDDDENNRTVLCDALGGEPYALLEAVDGTQALEMARKELPDLVLLDVMMPNIDGAVVLQTLKSHESTRHIPVIMVTALNMESQISMCLDRGAIDHIAKPFSALLVRARVRAALRDRTPAAAGTQCPRKPGKLIGFIGAKGGAGTTTLAVNTALALAGPQRSVVLAELRSCMGTVAQQLGLTPAINLRPLLDSEEAGAINARTLSRCLTPHATGLKLLLAPPIFGDQRDLTPQQAEDILKVLAGMADCVVVDFPALTSNSTMAALRCCNFVALTVEREATSLASAQAMLKGLASCGLAGDLVGAVLVNHAATDSPLSVAHVRTQLTCPIVGVVPPAAKLCRAALKTGQPLVRSQPESNVAAALTELAARLMADQAPAMAFGRA
jgi:CheY-like chemotaxis protein/MinD-like ATPase involved in chromosome partitioning or flagellar assembly